MKTCLAILGMHRSGTSALTRMVSLLGAELPRRMMQAKDNNNSEGFWESHDVYLLNDRLFRELGLDWTHWQSMQDGWLPALGSPENLQAAAQALELNFEQAELFALKDPRLCRLLPFWRPALEAMGCETRCIIPFRHPAEVAASLQKRDALDPTTAEMIWLRYVLESEQHSRGLPRSFASYSDLLTDWRQLSDRLANQADLIWPRMSTSAAAEIDLFLSPHHRHHAADGHDARICDWSRSCYQALQSLCEDPHTPASMAEMDRLRAEFDRAGDSLAPLLVSRRHSSPAPLAETAAQVPAFPSDGATDDAPPQKSRFRQQARRETQELRRLRSQKDRLRQRLDSMASIIATPAENLPPAQSRHAPVRANTKRPALTTKQPGSASRRFCRLDVPLPLPSRYLGRAITAGQRWSLWRQARQLRNSGLFDANWYLLRNPDVAAAGIPAIWHWLLLGWREQRAPNPLFKPAWYQKRHPGPGDSEQNPLWHYLIEGATQGADPGPLFQTNWYLENNPDVAAAGINPLAHYLNRGWKEGRSPNPVFDPLWYQQQHPTSSDCRFGPIEHYVCGLDTEAFSPSPWFDGRWYLMRYPDASRSGHSALEHYLEYGQRQGLRPNPWCKPLAKWGEALQADEFFDARWYCRQHPDLVNLGPAALAHFLAHGRHEGRSPGPLLDLAWYAKRHNDAAAYPFGPGAHYLDLGEAANLAPSWCFDPGWYLQRYSDVAAGQLSAARHFLRFGASEGRDPNPLFEMTWYREQQAQLSSNSLLALEHYLCEGHLLGLDPSPLFQTSWYRNHHAELLDEHENPLQHYLSQDPASTCQPNALFDPAWYRSRYPEASSSRINPLSHYLGQGEKLGLQPSPYFDPEWYLRQTENDSNAAAACLRHFFARGAAQGLSPNALFDEAWYRQQCAELMPGEQPAVVHYLDFGRDLGLSPSPLIDMSWLQSQDEDIPAALRHDPLRYLLECGPETYRDPSPWFDSAWYLKKHPELKDSRPNPLLHYLTCGEPAGWQPNLLFEPRWYRRRYMRHGDPASALAHYAQGAAGELRNPGPFFDCRWYVQRYPDIAGHHPLLHFLQHGQFEGRDPNGLFDTDWYLAHHDAAQATKEESVYARYLAEGMAKGRSPGPLFDPTWYAGTHKLATDSRLSAYEHYARAGRKRGLSPHPWFDVPWYQQRYGETLGDWEPVAHYLLRGAKQGLDPCPLFDSDWFIAHQARLDEIHENPLLLFLRRRAQESLTPNGWIDGSWYRQQYPDIAQSNMDPVRHYLTFGWQEGRSPGPCFDARWYSQAYALESAAKTHPLEHFLSQGRLKGYAAKASALFAATQDLPEITRYTGLKPPLAGQPNILLCGHAAKAERFGGERSFLDLLRMGTEMHYNFHVCLPEIEESYLQQLRELCVEVVHIPFSGWQHDSGAKEMAVAALKAYAIDRDIDLFHINTIVTVEPLLAANSLGIPAAIHVRESVRKDPWIAQDIGLSADQVIAEVCSGAQAIIANSATTAEEFHLPDATFVVPNCFDFERLDIALRPAQNPLRVGLISSNQPKKGIEDFALLARACAADALDIEFLLIGPENEHTQALRARQQTGELPSTLQFLGYQESPEQALAEVDVLVSLSHFAESFGRTVLEALAARRPVIVYDHGHPPKLVENGLSGFVIPYREWMDALVHLKRWSNDRACMARMGEYGRNRTSQQYHFARGRDALRKAYQHLLPDQAQKPSETRVLPARKAGYGQGVELKLAYFCWHFPVPSETFVLNELAELRQQGIDVKVYCRHSPHEDFRPGFPISWEQVESVQGLADSLRRDERNFLHAHFIFPTVTEFAWPACELAKLPFTAIAHAQDIFRYQADRDNRIAQITASPLCQRIFVLSKEHRDHLLMRQVPAEKLYINPNCLDSGQFDWKARPDKTSSTVKVCAIQRFTQKKGLTTLIQAAEQLRDQDIEFHIYGSGEEQAELERLIREAKLNKVQMHGALAPGQAVSDVLRQHALYVFSGHRAANGDMDGIPTSVLEAMSAGVPVVATRLSGLPDIISDGVHGFLAQPEDARSLASAILKALSLSSEQSEQLARNAATLVRRRHDRRVTVGRLLREWQGFRLDIVIVSWNNCRELSEVISRLFRWTRTPFHLLICDNASELSTRAYLCALQQEHDNVTVIFQADNLLVGPGTNAALAHGRSDYAIYVCGKEGFALSEGWELDLIDALEQQARTGLAGSLCHSPSYLHGPEYASGIPLFDQFRGKQYAAEQEREMQHVQGGLFILRRAMLDAIGGFSTEVPHAYTDVEYSLHAESQGWELASVGSTLSLYSKTRPDFWSRMDEQVRVIHSPTLSDLTLLDHIATAKVNLCNLCHWSGHFQTPQTAICPQCGSSGQDRTLYRYLAESTLPYRNLSTLALQPPQALHAFLSEAFDTHFLDDLSPDVLASATLVFAFSGAVDKLLELLAQGAKPPEELFVITPEASVQRTLAQHYPSVSRIAYASQVLGFGLDPVLHFKL